jgi:RNA polymerase sigma-70 factor (ECF subfamily)
MAHAHSTKAPENGLTPSAVSALVDNHRHFLGFLERRLGDRALAEDILQDAFVRGIDRLGTLNQEESVVAWFYRLLRNAVTDHYRRRAASNKKLERLAHELEALGNADPELSASVCRCVGRLAETLKPEYAEALRRVELDGVSVKSYADEAGISSNNAGIRIFRAREALRKRVARSCGTCAEHGCLDCTCETSPGHCQVRDSIDRDVP